MIQSFSKNFLGRKINLQRINIDTFCTSGVDIDQSLRIKIVDAEFHIEIEQLKELEKNQLIKIIEDGIEEGEPQDFEMLAKRKDGENMMNIQNECNYIQEIVYEEEGNTNNYSDSSIENQELDDNPNSAKINIDYFRDLSFQAENRKILSKVVKDWAIEHSFEMIFPEGEKVLAAGVKKSILKCNFTEIIDNELFDCPFQLIFKTEENMYKLAEFYNVHNHSLKKLNIITPTIKYAMTKLHTKMTPAELVEYINLEFHAEFSYNAIYYECQKISEETWGKPSEDCHRLIEILEQDLKIGMAHFATQVNAKKELTHVFYSAKEWKKLYEKFSDVVIMDSTLGKNRFNMPLTLLIAIDNNGRSRIISFALTCDTTQKTSW